MDLSNYIFLRIIFILWYVYPLTQSICRILKRRKDFLSSWYHHDPCLCILYSFIKCQNTNTISEINVGNFFFVSLYRISLIPYWVQQQSLSFFYSPFPLFFSYSICLLLFIFLSISKFKFIMISLLKKNNYFLIFWWTK